MSGPDERRRATSSPGARTGAPPVPAPPTRMITRFNVTRAAVAEEQGHPQRGQEGSPPGVAESGGGGDEDHGGPSDDQGERRQDASDRHLLRDVGRVEEQDGEGREEQRMDGEGPPAQRPETIAELAPCPAERCGGGGHDQDRSRYRTLGEPGRPSLR